MQVTRGRRGRWFPFLPLLAALLLTVGPPRVGLYGTARGETKAAADGRRPPGRGESQASAGLNYQILKAGCSKEGYCSAIVFVAPAHFDEQDLLKLAKALRPKYLYKTSASFYLFDNSELAKTHTTGARELNDLGREVRGYYYRDRDEEYIKYIVDVRTQERRTINLKTKRRLKNRTR